MRFVRIFGPSLLMSLTLTWTGALAQQQAPATTGEELVDRVVAVVGDTILLASDVQAELLQLRASGQLGNDPAQIDAAARQILDSKVNDLILVSAARRAKVTVDDERVTAAADAEIATVRSRFRTEAEFQNALAQSGLTFERYRQASINRNRDRLLVVRFLQERFANRARPVINESEIQRFFDSQAQAFGERPALIAFRQVVVKSEPSAEARQAAIERAQQVLRELQEGADFSVLAGRFSDDEGTASLGGDLGWFGTGRMVPEFERVAFSLRPGQTSGIVETEFGFHIIRLERQRGAERNARHILIQPEVTEADVEIARQRADSVLTALRGGASIQSLASAYNPPEEVTTVDLRPIDSLPPEYGQALADAAAGDFVGPIRISHPLGDRWAVIRVTEMSPAGPYTIDELRERIREQLQNDVMMEQLLADLRGQVYVRVAP